MRRALLSVSDKTGLVDFGRGLVELGFELVSTGGTASALREGGLAVTSVDEVTGHPEIMGGRVKTLHPKIHGGILARLDNPSDIEEMTAAGIDAIELVVVNLYPFEEWANRKGPSHAEIVEHIDVGGPAMVRAAAKNHARVGVLTDPVQYDGVLEELTSGGALSDDTRTRLAAAAFEHTACYDAAIAEWMRAGMEGFPDTLLLSFDRYTDLSYGENPHQRAAYYVERSSRIDLLSRVDQLHGKALSFNNLLDLEAARNLAGEFELPVCVIVKHNNPCGVAVGSTILDAYERALACDPVSAYGGVIVVNRQVEGALGERLANTFVEVLQAPSYSDDALAALTVKPNTRLMRDDERRRSNPGEMDFRRVTGGLLLQDRDADTDERDSMSLATTTAPSEAQWGDLLFAWRVAKHVKSNAIVMVKGLATIGVGAGQMSRVDSVRLATEKAGIAELSLQGAALASDAFFPFPDGPETAIAAGITSIIQPGGSIRDNEIVEACDRLGAAMVLTGRRHFRH